MKAWYALLLTLTACLSLTACGNAGNEPLEPSASPETPSAVSGAFTDPESQPPTNSNSFLANTAWIAGDASYMVFWEDDRYAWYQTQEIPDDNYYAGTYRFFMGDAALTHLTTDLADFGVTADEMQGVFDRNEDYSLDNFVCMTIDNDSFILNGEEQLDQIKTISYFGFLLEDGTYLDIANMTTGTYYKFTKEVS